MLNRDNNSADDPTYTYEMRSYLDYTQEPRSQTLPPPQATKPPQKANDAPAEEEHSFDNDVLGTFAGKTSLCGVAYIRQSTHIITRCIWFFIFMGMLGASIWQLIAVFQKYFEHPIKTEISLGFSTLNFPTVTLCNVNPIRRSMVDLDPELETFVQRLEDLFAYHDDWSGWSDPDYDGEKRKRRRKRSDTKVKRQADAGNSSDYYDYYYYDWYAEYGSGSDYEDYGDTTDDVKQASQFRTILANIPRAIRNEMGHQKEMAIISCAYHGKTCSAANFTTILSPEYGNCFQFNAPPLRPSAVRSKRSGVTSGLNLVLFSEKAEYLQSFTEESGFQISVEPFNTMAVPKDEGISLSPGFQTNIGLKYLNISRLGNPSVAKEKPWKCENGEQFWKEYGHNYTVQSCLDTCTDKSIGQVCACMRPEYLDFYPLLNRSLTSCYADDVKKKCAGKVATDIITGSISCSCDQACNEFQYQTSYSMLRWPNSGMWVQLARKVCVAQYRFSVAYPDATVSDYCEYLIDVTDPDEQRFEMASSFFKVNIYYESLNFETIVESEDYPLEQFGADIGGTIGLWTGFCIFTALELVDLVIQILFYCCYTRWQQAAPQQNGRGARYNDAYAPRPQAHAPPPPAMVHVPGVRHFSGADSPSYYR